MEPGRQLYIFIDIFRMCSLRRILQMKPINTMKISRDYLRPENPLYFRCVSFLSQFEAQFYPMPRPSNCFIIDNFS